MEDCRPELSLRATNREDDPKARMEAGIVLICTDLSAPCMTPLKTLAVPRVMISVGTVSLEVKRPLKAPRSAPRPAAIRNGTMTGPFHPLSTRTFVVT